MLIVIFITTELNAQVQWKFTAKKIADKIYEIHLTATVDESWHIYSQATPKGGPLPTKIVINKNPFISLQGKADEVGEMEEYHSEVFDVDVIAFSDTVDFVQKVKLKATAKTKMSGSVEYMACTKYQCLTPTTVKFNIRIE